MRSSRPAVAALALALAALAPGHGVAACVGDCYGDRRVAVNEPIAGVDIALGKASVDSCAALDANRDGAVGIDELVAAVDNALHGCPANRPPLLPAPSIYRTYSGFEIRLPIGASDPDGDLVRCTAAPLPDGASFDENGMLLSWTPADDQLGPFYVPFSCADDAPSPAVADGTLVFAVAQLDECAVPSCDPATGCTAALPPLDQRCCSAAAATRIAEPVAACPAGRVLFVGQNATSHTFGRLQNCDVMRVKNFQQSGAEVQLHIETRCVNTREKVRLHVRMESDAEFHPLFFDVVTRRFSLSNDPDGFARQRGLRFSIGGGGPFFDLQDAEANLTVTLTDDDGVEVTDELRVRLSFTPQPDRPDVDPTPTAD
jgi:hypothetical protein